MLQLHEIQQLEAREPKFGHTALSGLSNPVNVGEHVSRKGEAGGECHTVD